MKRRSFLASSGALAAGLAATGAPRSARAASTDPARQKSIGLQLFTVMANLEKDFEGTLRKVADTGYREVETIGAFGRDPAMVRDLLDKYGLVSPSQHLVPGDLYDVFSSFTTRNMSTDDVRKHWLSVMSIDKVDSIIEQGIERAGVLGQRYIVWQIIWPEQMATRKLTEDFARAMDRAGEICSKAGFVFCFHNHDIEMKKVDDFIPYDVILANTNPDKVKLEIDVFWAHKAGADVGKYFAQHPGRFLQCHLKDSTADGDFATVGQGVLDFPKLLAQARDAGIRHYYVEYDRSADPLRAIRESFAYLSKLF